MDIKRLISSITAVGEAWKVGRLTHVPVFFTGETGSGKEYFALMLAQIAGLTLSAVNLGALAESMVEAELFGHERGAYTGATSARVGLLEAATGAILLDEVGKSSLKVQTALLRAVDTREVRRVGANKPRRFSAPVIFAASEDIPGEIAAGRFSRDLWERIGVRLHVPPLRERRDEIDGLLVSFARREGVEIDADVFIWAQKYEWSGNIREVARTVEACALVDGRVTRRGCVERTQSATVEDLLRVGASAQAIAEVSGERYNSCWQRLNRRVKAGELKRSAGRFYSVGAVS